MARFNFKDRQNIKLNKNITNKSKHQSDYLTVNHKIYTYIYIYIDKPISRRKYIPTESNTQTGHRVYSNFYNPVSSSSYVPSIAYIAVTH